MARRPMIAARAPLFSGLFPATRRMPRRGWPPYAISGCKYWRVRRTASSADMTPSKAWCTVT